MQANTTYGKAGVAASDKKKILSNNKENKWRMETTWLTDFQMFV